MSVKSFVRGNAGSDVSTDESYQRTISSYMDSYSAAAGGSADKRKAEYTTLINNFYNVATDFYEWGWGESFHFAPRFVGESFAASIARHEHFLAAQMRLQPGQTVLDLGCGVGGPARAIARFSGATVIGVNNNAYQIERARKLTKKAGLEHLVSYQKADFMHLPFADASVDAIFHIEACCHSPERPALFREISRVLKPGGVFAGYDWTMKPAYDAANPLHRRVKEAIEVGNGLPEILPTSQVLDALNASGLRVELSKDITDDFNAQSDVPWYEPLSAKCSLTGFKHTTLGRVFTHTLVTMLEKLRIAPTGASATSAMLNGAAASLSEGGKLDIFTPMLFYVARKA